MNRNKPFLWILFSLLFGINWHCAITSTQLPEPEAKDRVLVVGSITVDLFEYRGITQTYRSEIQVIIAGRFKKDGKIIHKNFWVKTDDRGYFFLANVPKGDYALRGFRFQIVGPDFNMTVVNPLRTERDRWIAGRTPKIPEAAFVFPIPSQGNIVNLRHNYFIIDRGTTVHHKVYYRLDNLRLITGKILQEPDILSYFREKYPNNLWLKNR